MATNVGDAILGAFQSVQAAGQRRADNVYRNKVLDLDNRTLDERIRQFNLANQADEATRQIQRDQVQIDRDQLTETNRANIELEKDRTAKNKLEADRIRVLDKTADIEQNKVDRLASKDFNDKKITYATNKARSFFTSGKLNPTATDLNNDFFAQDAEGRRVNRNDIIDLLNQRQFDGSRMAVLQDGSFKDMEVAGFTYDPNTGKTTLNLRGRNTDEEVVPATQGASQNDDDPVIELDEDQFRSLVSRAYKTGVTPYIDNEQLNLGAARTGELLRQQRVNTVEAQISAEVEKRVVNAVEDPSQVPALLRQFEADLAATADDPEGRKALLDSVGIDPAQFDTAPDPIDTDMEYAGPEEPIKDPLGPGGAVFGAGGFVARSQKARGKPPYRDLVAELQANFKESEAVGTTRRMTGAERDEANRDLNNRRLELLANIGPEIAARKEARVEYEAALDQQNITQNTRNQRLADYDAYIAQLENYLPPQEKATIDVGVEVSKLLSSNPQQLLSSIEDGSFPITQEQLGAIRQHLVDKKVSSLMDVAEQDITTQFAALTAAAVTTQDETARKAAMENLVNAAETGLAGMDANQAATQQLESRKQDLAEVEQRAERTDKARERQDTITEQVATKVAPLQQELANTFAAANKAIDPTGLTQDQIKELKAQQAKKDFNQLSPKGMLARTRSLWEGGAGAKAYNAATSRAPISNTERKAYTDVFNASASATVQALLARKTKDSRVVDFFFDDDEQSFWETVGLMDQDIPSIDTTSKSLASILPQQNSNGDITGFKVVDPEGGAFSGKVTAADVRRELGADAYDLFLSQLRQNGKLEEPSGG